MCSQAFKEPPVTANNLVTEIQKLIGTHAASRAHPYTNTHATVIHRDYELVSVCVCVLCPLQVYPLLVVVVIVAERFVPIA